jgi:hypothetical protein
MLVPYPAAFAYALAVAVYVALGLVVFAAATLLAIWPSGRRVARWLAGGVIGSFPFVMFFQGLSLPVLATIAILLFVFGIWSGPPDGPNMFIALAGLGLMFAVFVAASVTGFIAGWAVGGRVASGTPIRDALRASWALKALAAGLNRLSPISKAITPERGIAVGVGIIILTAGGLMLARAAYVEHYGSDEMDYRGEKIRLANKYVDYDDYKNDPGNIAPSEIARVERIMTEARIGPDFADWKAFVDQAFTIKFPGYGMGSGPKDAATGREFIVEVIEIPQAAKDRYFVLEKMAGGALRLVDDFVRPRGRWSAFGAISSIRLVDDRLVYTDRDSKVVRETSARPQQ